MSEPLTQEYLDTKLDEKFDKFADTVQRGFQDVREQQNALRTDLVGVMDTKLGALRTDLVGVMDTKLTTLRTDLVTVIDTKLGLLEDRLTTKFDERLTEKTSEVITHVDAFASLHQKLEHELTAMRAKYERLEERLVRVEKHLALQPA